MRGLSRGPQLPPWVQCWETCSGRTLWGVSRRFGLDKNWRAERSHLGLLKSQVPSKLTPGNCPGAARNQKPQHCTQGGSWGPLGLSSDCRFQNVSWSDDCTVGVNSLITIDASHSQFSTSVRVCRRRWWQRRRAPRPRPWRRWPPCRPSRAPASSWEKRRQAAPWRS